MKTMSLIKLLILSINMGIICKGQTFSMYDGHNLYPEEPDGEESFVYCESNFDSIIKDLCSHRSTGYTLKGPEKEMRGLFCNFSGFYDDPLKKQCCCVGCNENELRNYCPQPEFKPKFNTYVSTYMKIYRFIMRAILDQNNLEIDYE